MPVGVSVVVRRAQGYEHRGGSVPAGSRYGVGRPAVSAPAPNGAAGHVNPNSGYPNVSHANPAHPNAVLSNAGHPNAGHQGGVQGHPHAGYQGHPNGAYQGQPNGAYQGQPNGAQQVAGHQAAGHYAHPPAAHPGHSVNGYQAAAYPEPGDPVTGRPTARPTGYPNGYPNAGQVNAARVNAPRATTQPANGYPATANAPAYGQSPAPAQSRAIAVQPGNVAPQNVSVAAQIGSFFRDLRRNFKISQPEIASRLGTRIEIIAALEAGDVRNLPSWPETCRIVQTYTGFAGLDPRPVLRLIEMMQMRTGRQPTVVAHTYEDESGIFSRAAKGMAGLAGPVGRGLRVMVALSIPVALILLVTQTSVLEAAVTRLPPPMKRIVRGAQNYVIVQLAPVREGLRWIDVPDPRSRRGDKLPSPGPSD